MNELQWDVLVTGGYVVLADDVSTLDIGIRAGKIELIAPHITGEAVKVIDASGLYVMPGVVDVHVHLDEPGLGSWEGFASGSQALAAGGCTTYVDMPLNGLPPTVHMEALNLKLGAARESGSAVDFALWGGLVPDNLDELEALAAAGVVGFKAFLSSPGETGEGCFRNIDEDTLYEGMKRIAALDKVLALHAESEPIVSELAAEKRAAGCVTMRDYLDSRPPQAEVEAVRTAVGMAAETGCSLHIVHVSTPAAVDLLQQAKQAGIDVTIETCPHYLAFNDEDVIRIGALAKCSPPIRTEQDREELWARVANGQIDIIASDHSPCPPEMKKVQDGNYFDVWGGIAGAQSTLELVVSEGWLKRGIPLPTLARALSTKPAERFGLSDRKGIIAGGMDADLVLVDLSAPYVLQAEQLKYRHRYSAYTGYSFACQVSTTLLRGEVVYTREAAVPIPQVSGVWMEPCKGTALQV